MPNPFAVFLKYIGEIFYDWRAHRVQLNPKAHFRQRSQFRPYPERIESYPAWILLGQTILSISKRSVFAVEATAAGGFP